jgi:hypothetical protein
MKKLLLLSLLLQSLAGFAQEERLQFQYDAAGNQIVSRLVCINCPEDPGAGGGEAPVDNTPIVLSEKTLNQLTYFPNPVSQELTLLWKNNPHRRITSISVYTLGGKRALYASPLNLQESLVLSFSALASGVYEVVALTSDGKTEAFKILKK